MEIETGWEEVLIENDERIALLEADILESKAMLSRLTTEEEIEFLGFLN